MRYDKCHAFVYVSNGGGSNPLPFLLAKELSNPFYAFVVWLNKKYPIFSFLSKQLFQKAIIDVKHLFRAEPHQRCVPSPKNKLAAHCVVTIFFLSPPKMMLYVFLCTVCPPRGQSKGVSPAIKRVETDKTCLQYNSMRSCNLEYKRLGIQETSEKFHVYILHSSHSCAA